MPGLYVTKEEGKTLSFNYSYKQTFYHDVKVNRGLPEYSVITNFVALPEKTQKVILEMLLFIKKFEFASIDQIQAMLQRKGLADIDIELVLDSCVSDCLLNFFIISQYDLGEIPKDAFRVYCLDTRAIFILSHFSSLDTVSWFSTDSVRCIELVTKYLATGGFYQQLYEVNKSSLRDFSPVFNANIGRRMIRFSSSFMLMAGYTPLNYIFEVVRSYDLPGPWQKKVGEQISVFDQEKFWHKYYDMKPYYLFLVENEEQGLEVAEIFYRLTDNSEFQIITDKVLTEGLASTKIFDYSPEQRALILSNGPHLGTSK